MTKRICKSAPTQANNPSQGFTLIELLVVVSIISILTVAALTNSVNAIRRARDAKRLRDMSAIRTALELYFADNGEYPGPKNENIPIQGEVIGGDTQSNIDKVLLQYMEHVPSDPLNDNGTLFFYSYDPQHCLDDPPKSCNCAIWGGVVFGFNKSEGIDSTKLQKDTCSGCDQNLCNADYNVSLVPMPN